MSAEAWAGMAITLVGLCATALGTLVGFVWNAAKTSTEHRMRIAALETKQADTGTRVENQGKSIVMIDKHLYALEHGRTPSQADITERPPAE